MRALATVLLLSLAGCHVTSSLEDCGADSDCESGERCNPAGRFCELDTSPVLLGVVVTPPISDVDRVAAEFTERFLNDRGGIVGRPVELVFLDEQPTETLIEQLDAFLERDPLAVLNGPSRTVLEVQARTYPRQILHITGDATTPLLSTAQPEGDRYSFRTAAPVNLGEAAAMSYWVGRDQPPDGACASLSIAHSRSSAYRVGYHGAVHDLLPKLGSCVARDFVLPDEPQAGYPGLVDALRDTGRGCLLLLDDSRLALPTLLSDLRRATRDLGWDDLQILGGGNMRSPSFLERVQLNPPDVSPTAAEGVVLASAYQDVERPARLFLERELGRYLGAPPEDDHVRVGASLFDTALIVALAAERAGSLEDRVALRDSVWAVATPGPESTALSAADYERAVSQLSGGREIYYVAAAGDIIFDQLGDTARDMTVLQIVNGVPSEQRVYRAEELRALDSMPAAAPSTCPATAVTYISPAMP